MSSVTATPVLRRSYCAAEECQKFATCPEALRPEVRLLAEVARQEIRLYAAPHAMTCYAPVYVVRPLAFPITQPKSRKAAAALYGSDFDPSRCIKAISGLSGFWQCGHPNGKGTHGLYCGRHA